MEFHTSDITSTWPHGQKQRYHKQLDFDKVWLSLHPSKVCIHTTYIVIYECMYPLVHVGIVMSRYANVLNAK